MLVGSLPSVFAAQASDIEDHWAQQEIETWLKRFASGLSRWWPSPDAAVTRAEFITLPTRPLISHLQAGEAGFSDVAEDAWYYGDVATAKKAAYISAIDGTFRPTIPSSPGSSSCAKQGSQDEGAGDKLPDQNKIAAWAQAQVEAVTPPAS